MTSMHVDIAIKKSTFILLALLMAVFLAIDFLDKALFSGIFLVIFLTLITCLIFYKFGIRGKDFYLLFLITIILHVAVVLFFHYAKFQPFGEGDFVLYQQTAEQ